MSKLSTGTVYIKYKINTWMVIDSKLVHSTKVSKILITLTSFKKVMDLPFKKKDFYIITQENTVLRYGFSKENKTMSASLLDVVV